MSDNPNEPSENSSARPKNNSVSPKGRSGGGGSRERQRTMLVRYGKMALLGQFQHHEREISPSVRHVVVHTERGMELGEIVSPYCHPRGTCGISRERIDDYTQQSGPNYPLSRDGRFVRFATDQDLNEQRHLDKAVREKLHYCEELIAKHNLPMRLVTAEHLFGGDRIIYYFTAESRVDFRRLVRELAQQYQTRIEMRQIGARDEARLVADFETCGRECCCKNFLKVLQPVNMRMAKVQKATLDPSKISGRCGRLKCCLRYEDTVYTELVKRLPKTSSWVTTEHGLGQVLDTQPLTQLVRIRLEVGRVIAINVDEIQERHSKPPVRQEQAAAASRPTGPARSSASGQEAPQAQPEASTEDTAQQRKKRKRRRRRKKNDGAESSGPEGGQG